MADPEFPRGGGASPSGRGGRPHMILPNFPKNCMKLKEFLPPGEGVRVPSALPLDPPLDFRHGKTGRVFFPTVKLVSREKRLNLIYLEDPGGVTRDNPPSPRPPYGPKLL